MKFKDLNSGDWFKSEQRFVLFRLNDPFIKMDRIEDKWGSAWNAVSVLGVPEEFNDNEDVEPITKLPLPQEEGLIDYRDPFR